MAVLNAELRSMRLRAFSGRRASAYEVVDDVPLEDDGRDAGLDPSQDVTATRDKAGPSPAAGEANPERLPERAFSGLMDLASSSRAASPAAPAPSPPVDKPKRKRSTGVKTGTLDKPFPGRSPEKVDSFGPVTRRRG